MDRPTCETCRYWECVDARAEESETNGVCRRYPPARIANPEYEEIASDGFWPWTRGDADWCGEHATAAEAVQQQKEIQR